jgi:probable HAF family extracellular repeat protein
MKRRVVPSALSLILSGGIPGLIAVTPAPAAATKSAYTVTDLGNLGGGVSLGFGINASGEVVGRSYLDNVFFFKCGKHTCRFTQNDPFRWTAGTMADLGTFSATAMSEATAVNRGGDVVGGSSGHALLVHNGTMTDLGTLGSTQSRVRDQRQRPDRRQRLQRPRPGARVPAHPASVRAQDLPPARLIHAGRNGRLRGARDCSHHLAERTDTGGRPP